MVVAAGFIQRAKVAKTGSGPEPPGPFEPCLLPAADRFDSWCVIGFTDPSVPLALPIPGAAGPPHAGGHLPPGPAGAAPRSRNPRPPVHEGRFNRLSLHSLRNSPPAGGTGSTSLPRPSLPALPYWRPGEHWGGVSVKPTMTKSLFLLVVGLGLVAGCGHSRSADPAPTRFSTSQRSALTEAEVVAIARQAVATNDTWLDRAEFETPRRRPDGSWSLLVWRLPKTPGGHRVIHINDQGQVTRYFRGN